MQHHCGLVAWNVATGNPRGKSVFTQNISENTQLSSVPHRKGRTPKHEKVHELRAKTITCEH
jgi:hypothetical protein